VGIENQFIPDGAIPDGLVRFVWMQLQPASFHPVFQSDFDVLCLSYHLIC